MRLGFIIPCYNEENQIIDSIKKLKKYLSSNVINKNISKVIFCIIDDGSTDNTWLNLKKIVLKKEKKFSFILVKLKNNFGHQNALLAGMSEIANKVDCAISIDADLEHDIKTIPRFIKKFLEGNEIVLGVRRNRDGDKLLKKITSNIFYALSNLSGANIKKNHADFRLLSNTVMKHLIMLKSKNLFLRGSINNLNFKKTDILFDVKVNKSRKSRYSLIKMINLAFDSVTLTGKFPLRILSLLGLLLILFSLSMMTYILFMRLTYEHVVPGWASSVLPIYFIGGLNMFAIAIIGEYVGRIYEFVTEKPNYIIEEKIIK